VDRLEPELAEAGKALNIYAEIGRSKIFFLLKFEFLGLRLARLKYFIKFSPELFKDKNGPKMEGYRNIQMRMKL
jgi:hypothetical protein